MTLWEALRQAQVEEGLVRAVQSLYTWSVRRE